MEILFMIPIIFGMTRVSMSFMTEDNLRHVKLVFQSTTVVMSFSITYLWVMTSTPTTSGTNTVLRRRTGSHHRLSMMPGCFNLSRGPESSLQQTRASQKE